MLFLDVRKKVILRQALKKDGHLRQPIACYEIAKRTYDFVMTYVGNRTINMTLVMLFLVDNKTFYVIIYDHLGDSFKLATPSPSPPTIHTYTCTQTRTRFLDVESDQCTLYTLAADSNALPMTIPGFQFVKRKENEPVI